MRPDKSTPQIVPAIRPINSTWPKNRQQAEAMIVRDLGIVACRARCLRWRRGARLGFCFYRQFVGKLYVGDAGKRPAFEPVKIKITWIGRTKEAAVASLTEEYLKRISRYAQIEGVVL